MDGYAVAVPIDEVEEPLRIRSQGTLARLNEDVSTWLFLEDHVDWDDLTAEDLRGDALDLDVCRRPGS